MTTAGRFDSLPCLAYANALFIIGTLGTLITPALLAAWASHDWGTTRLGILAGIELAGLSLASLSGLWWQRRTPWRRVAVFALLLGIVGNGLCVLLGNYLAVCAARLMVGLAGGLLTALYSAVLANAAAPARVIAVTTFIQIGVEAVFLYSSASLFAHLGTSALFSGMAGLFVVLLPLIRSLPAAWPQAGTSSAQTDTGATHSPRAYPLLASFVPFIIVQTGVYTFLGEFAHRAAHLSESEALRVIGISVIFSALGSVAAFVMSDRFGLRVPIGVAIALITVTLCGMILGPPSELLFLTNIALLQIGWIFLNCFLYSAVIETNNLLVVAATPISALGSVLGASLMGYVLEQRALPGALALCLAALVLTALLTLPFLRRRSGPLQIGAGSPGGETGAFTPSRH